MVNSLIKSVLIFVFAISWTNSFSQKELVGTYSYKYVKRPYFFSESISLYGNGCFNYKVRSAMGIASEINGNWQQRDSLLVLDSRPQHDKIIAWESYNKKSIGTNFKVVDKKGEPFLYHLYAILGNGDTLIVRDQWAQTKIKERIKSFWLMDTKGLTSYEYIVKSKHYNTIDIIFDLQRIFENEDWLITVGKGIKPRGIDGNMQNYYLTKEEEY